MNTFGISEKSRFSSFILCLFFGVFGVHRFYLERPVSGFIMLMTLGGLGIWSFFDLILIFFGAMKDGEQFRVSDWKTGSFLKATLILLTATFVIGAVTTKFFLPKIQIQIPNAVQDFIKKTGSSFPKSFRIPTNAPLPVKDRKDTSGELVKWVDDKGVTHYVNDISKVPEQYRDQVKTNLSLPSLNITK